MNMREQMIINGLKNDIAEKTPAATSASFVTSITLALPFENTTSVMVLAVRGSYKLRTASGS